MLGVQQVAVNQVPAFLSLLINVLNARGKECLTKNIIMFLSPLENLKYFTFLLLVILTILMVVLLVQRFLN